MKQMVEVKTNRENEEKLKTMRDCYREQRERYKKIKRDMRHWVYFRAELRQGSERGGGGRKRERERERERERARERA